MQDQYQTILNAVLGNTSVTTSFSINDGVKQGSIMITTSSAYNGTTGTAVLNGSNDNTNFQAVLQDDNSTAMSFTLTVSQNSTFLLKRVLYKYYQLVYTKGNASAGTLTVNFIGKI